MIQLQMKKVYRQHEAEHRLLNIAGEVARGSYAEMAWEQMKREEAIMTLDDESGIVDYAVEGPARIAKRTYYALNDVVPSIAHAAGGQQFALVHDNNPLREPLEGAQTILSSAARLDLPGLASAVILEGPDRLIKGAMNILPGEHYVKVPVGDTRSRVRSALREPSLN